MSLSATHREAANSGLDIPHGYQVINFDHRSPDYFLEQIVGRDLVHTFGADTMKNLLKHRVPSRKDDNRVCWGMIDPNGNVACVMYGHKDEQPANSGKDYCGNASEILNNPVRQLNGPVRQVIFYSVSGFVPGFAPGFIKAVYTLLKQDEQYKNAKFSTLSPGRTFDAYLIACNQHDDFNLLESKEQKRKHKAVLLNIKDMQAGDERKAELEDLYKRHVDPILLAPESDQKKLMLHYLMLRLDPVQNLHMGNGARIADIKLDAGDSQGRCQIMVNYEYDLDADVLAANAARYETGTICGLVADHLIEETGMGHLKVGGIAPAAVAGPVSGTTPG